MNLFFAYFENMLVLSLVYHIKSQPLCEIGIVSLYHRPGKQSSGHLSSLGFYKAVKMWKLSPRLLTQSLVLVLFVNYYNYYISLSPYSNLTLYCIWAVLFTEMHSSFIPYYFAIISILLSIYLSILFEIANIIWNYTIIYKVSNFSYNFALNH